MDGRHFNCTHYLIPNVSLALPLIFSSSEECALNSLSRKEKTIGKFSVVGDVSVVDVQGFSTVVLLVTAKHIIMIVKHRCTSFFGFLLSYSSLIHPGVLIISCSDITDGNRMNLTDPRDPGGRLGPYTRQGGPDLRNFDIFSKVCKTGDILLLCSDGVHDNFDPQHLGSLLFSSFLTDIKGKLPRELGIDADTWDDVSEDIGTTVKTVLVSRTAFSHDSSFLEFPHFS